MQKMKYAYTVFCLIIVLLSGCSSVPEYNYIGMTREEVAVHLEKNAFRSRWSGNKFDIEILQRQMYSYSFKNAQGVVSNQMVMSSGTWRCGFYPQRHWLLGWNGLLARWHFQLLEFKDGRVVNQQRLRNYYWVKGEVGVSPHPQYPSNFHKVNKDIFRSGQPDGDELDSLYTFDGLRSVLNLRGIDSDTNKVKSVNRRRNGSLVLYNLPLETGNITESDLVRLLTVMRDAPKPLLIHCWHGSNRTGCAAAAYRIVFENWQVEDAVNELMKPEYGHHRYFFTNIPELLRKADWNKIKADVLRRKE